MIQSINQFVKWVKSKKINERKIKKERYRKKICKRKMARNLNEGKVLLMS